MAAGISWQGMDALQLRLFEAHLNALQALGGALNLEGEVIMTRSKDVFVPVDLGPLRASGFVEQPEYSAHEASVTLGYGGVAKDYALIQHENMEFHHPGQGGPKYLERPVREAQVGLGNRLARRIRRRIL